jgi:hypothetical protein
VGVVLVVRVNAVIDVVRAYCYVEFVYLVLYALSPIHSKDSITNLQPGDFAKNKSVMEIQFRDLSNQVKAQGKTFAIILKTA